MAENQGSRSAVNIKIVPLYRGSDKCRKRHFTTVGF
jgi:hypothetical protein